MDIKYKTIAKQAGKLLTYFNERNEFCFSNVEAFGVLKTNGRTAVLELLSSMVHKGLLMRLKKGIYYIIPYDQNAEAFMPDWHLLAQYLVGDAKYYIGYYSAMQIHSLITQPALKEQIVVSKQIKPSTIKIKDISFQFIYHNKKHFFGYQKAWVDSFNKVETSDIEKTFIDALFKPEYAGGISEIAKALYKSKDKLDFKKLLGYVQKFDSLAVSKRLGYLLELLDIQTSIINSLQKQHTHSYFLLEPSHPKEGKMLARWNIQENIDKQSIVSSIFT